MQDYVPGYRLLQEPQFDEPSINSRRPDEGDDFVEVEGAGDFLPPYSGNLDIMTAAATKVGEEIAKESLCQRPAGGGQALSIDDIYFDPMWDIRLTDTCLRDGSHHKRHQFTGEEVRAIVAALDDAGVPVIEVTHGDGLGGSSFNYGFSKTPEQELIKIAAETAKHAKIAFLMLPGVGTKDDIREAQDNGGSICRIATHCTEADVSIQHFGLARELGLETVGFLMMSHTQPPEVLAKQARIMVDAGCQCVYVVDSAGALVMEGVRGPGRRARRRDRLTTRRSASTATRTSASASPTRSRRCGREPRRSTDRAAASVPARATRRSRRSIGVCDKLGVKTGIDFFEIVDAAEDVVAPAMPEECLLDRMTLMMGYAGVYSSFLKHAIRQSERYGVSGAQAPAPCRSAQAHRRPGGPAHRHRAGDQARAGRRRRNGRQVGAAK